MVRALQILRKNRGKSRMVVIGIGVFLVLGFYFMVATSSSAELKEELKSDFTKIYTPTPAELEEITVSGIVSASDTVVVRAQVAGVATAVFASEGDMVSKNSLLAVQDLPVVNAEQNLAQTRAKLVSLTGDSSESLKNSYAAQQSLLEASSLAVSKEREASGKQSVNEAAKNLATVLDTAVVNMSVTADFVDRNKSYFPAEALSKYRNLLESMYSRQPSYLAGSLQYSLNSSDNILKKLELIRSDNNYNESEIKEVSTLVDLQFNLLTDILASAETNFFDGKKVEADDPLYSQYVEKRTVATSQQNALRHATAALKSTQSMTNEDLLHQEKNTATAGLVSTEATVQANFTKDLKRASDLVSQGEIGVTSAGLSLGYARAPFSGEVAKLDIEVGQYLLPGDSIMTLVGNGGKELKVNVPAVFLPYLKIGQEFVVDGNVLGLVGRFSSVSSNGGALVIIEVLNEDVLVGESLRGHLKLTGGATDLWSLPRAYVHFTSLGPAAKTKDGKIIPITIAFDYGGKLLVKGNLSTVSELLSTVSGSF